MEVQFLEPMAGSQVVYETNVIYDLPKDEAKRYIEHGICCLPEDAEDALEVKQTVIAPKPKAKKKAKK